MMTSRTGIALGMPKTALSPAAICKVPSPNETATPNRVARIAMTSIVLPSGPFTRSPISGRNTMLICRFVMPLR